MKLLLKNGANVNAKTDKAYTSLMIGILLKLICFKFGVYSSIPLSFGSQSKKDFRNSVGKWSGCEFNR